MHLPREIIQDIVDFFRNDRDTLASLRLLNHAWNIYASLYLFYAIRLYFPNPPRVAQPKFTRMEILLSLLESSTETISHCVRQVVLSQVFYLPLWHKTFLQKDDAVLIPFVVSRFTHMSSIVLGDIKWRNITPSLSSGILGICKSPTLERIDFRRCSMRIVSFLDILQESGNLKTLRLIQFDLEDFPHSRRGHLAQSSSSSSPSSENQYCTNITTPLLHSLTVLDSSDHLLNFFKVDLKQLQISHDNISGAKFLESVGQSLESLVIELGPLSIIYGPGEDIEPRLSTLVLALLSCPRVRHLRISGLPWSFSICPSIYFRSLLAQSPDQSLPIEHLQLVVHPVSVDRFVMCADGIISPSASSTGLPDPCHPAAVRHQCRPQCQHDDDDPVRQHLCCFGWFAVDDSLSRSGIFQSLKMLEISMQETRQRFMGLSDLSDAFPKLKSDGVQVVCTYLDDS